MSSVPAIGLPLGGHYGESDNCGVALNDHRGARILVVDDDPSIRSVLRPTLESAGFYMQSAADGLSAIKVFDRCGADLIIVDVNMPGIDGFAVCERIRQTNDVPVIFLTGAANPIVRAHPAQLVNAVGGDKLLDKPLDTQVLLTAIDELLSRKATR